ncbi:MAG: TetR/AcrR family transcriptional regulator [Candidatus Izemoplasmatales bacterium]
MNEKKRIHILETAMRLFNLYGFDATPTSKIAKKAKISVGTLFNYFPTKAELIQSIYVEIKIHSRKRYLEELNENQSNEENILSMWTAVIHWGIHYPEEFKYLEMFSTSPYIHNFGNDETLDTYSKFKETLLKAIDLNHLCINHPAYLLLYIDNALHAATRYLIHHKELIDQEAFIKESFELLWYGLTPKK